MLAPGFADPVFDAQAAFRALMETTAHPGRVVAISGVAAAPNPLFASTAALALTLLDGDTTVWLDDATDDAAAWLRFHTGAPLVDRPMDAAFAIVTRAETMPALATFNLASLDDPDRSTSVIVQVATLEGGTPLRLEGPGIRGEATIAPAPVPDNFARQIARNRDGFPCGVDVVLVAPDAVAALPRSVRLVERA